MTLIFDLDGTLVNSIYDLGDSVNLALSAHGLPEHTYDEYELFVGNGTRMLISRALPPDIRGTELENTVFEEFSALYEKNCLNKTAPYDGIPQCLRILKQMGAKLAVASNKPEEFSKRIVHSLFGDELFSVIAGSKDGIPKKPQPDIIEGILSKLSAQKNECVLIGDSDVDVQTARNAGIPCIGCSWGFRGRKCLEDAGCDIIIDTPYELENALCCLTN